MTKSAQSSQKPRTRPGSAKRTAASVRLRSTAESRLARRPAVETGDRPAAELLHELQVHQIELQMQNEALREAQVALEVSRDRFVDFYEFAPVGYLTLTETGVIAGINLTGAALLGEDRAHILQRRFASFVTEDTENVWRAHFASVLTREDKLDCELMLRREGNAAIDVRADSLRLVKEGQPASVRVVLTDITQRKQAEQHLRDMAAGLEQQVAERTRQLRAVSAQLTRAEERERCILAQELHDNLTQLLFVIKIKLSMLTPGSLQSSLDQIIELVDRAELAARSTMQQLSSPTLEALGLEASLESLSREFGHTHHLVVHFDADGASIPLAAEIKTILFRSVRELLINVARHAKVSEADLSCLWEESRLILVVSDAGCGFDAAHSLGAWSGPLHFGLRSVYERIVNLGGEMEIDSSLGHGTTIALTVPYSVAREMHQRP